MNYKRVVLKAFGGPEQLQLEQVNGLVPGQAVADMPVIGGYTQYLCVDADRLVPAPAGLDPAPAVAMILSYTTAYQMLTRLKKLEPGMSCLLRSPK